MSTLSSSAATVAVIGSGPAGVACAKALARRGVRVVVLDAGQTLDSGRRALVDKLAALPRSDWPDADVAALCDNATLFAGGIPKKLVFGSDYIYARDHPGNPIAGEAVAAAPTLSRGGYSMAWGGAMLPSADIDMAGWPFGRAALEPSYRRVLASFPVAAAADGLDRHFPTYVENSAGLGLPSQARALLADIERACPSGDDGGGDSLVCGQARLAVRGAGADGGGCRYCGMCLSGCVYGHIHSFDADIARLEAAGQISYRPGVLVRRLTEEDGGVRVEATTLGLEPVPDERFARVFLAAGALNSTRIMLESLGLYGHSVHFADSRKFVVPVLRLSRSPIEWPQINALAALFIEARFPDVSPHWMHVQVSPVNDLVLARLKVAERRGWRWRLLAPAVERLMVAWCSLHSNLSDGFSASLAPSPGGSPVMHLRPEPRPDAARVQRRMWGRLARHGLRFRSLFLPNYQTSPLGGTSHSGGSFPMGGGAAMRTATDLLGRPAGVSRIHMVDAAVLPSIPATTISLLLMANADRIAHEASLD